LVIGGVMSLSERFSLPAGKIPQKIGSERHQTMNYQMLASQCRRRIDGLAGKR
jgi:hypothetical protein